MSFSVAVLLVITLPLSSARDSCPSFANRKAACGVSSCGHFVYKGSYAAASSEQHLLSVSETAGKRFSSPASCCQVCRQSATCTYWSFSADSGTCLLYKKELCSLEEVYDPSTANSYVGGYCGESSSEPSETAKGSVEPLIKPIEDKSFCLVSDKELHINMMLGGYNDFRPPTSNFARKQTTRSWIRELAIFWSNSGKTHTLHFGARRGSKQERGDGFLQFIRVDGTEVPRLTLGDELSLFDGQAVVSFDAYEKAGASDVDVFKVQIPGLLDVELRVRPSHPALQLEGDAEVHISVDILELEFTKTVHGVLGQTYRSDRTDQTLNYAALTNLVHAIPEDKDKNADCLEGIAANYLSTSVTKPDCDFTQFSTELTGLRKAFQEAAQKTAEKTTEKKTEEIFESEGENSVDISFTATVDNLEAQEDEGEIGTDKVSVTETDESHETSKKDNKKDNEDDETGETEGQSVDAAASETESEGKNTGVGGSQ